MFLVCMYILHNIHNLLYYILHFKIDITNFYIHNIILSIHLHSGGMALKFEYDKI